VISGTGHTAGGADGGDGVGTAVGVGIGSGGTVGAGGGVGMSVGTGSEGAGTDGTGNVGIGSEVVKLGAGIGPPTLEALAGIMLIAATAAMVIAPSAAPATRVFTLHITTGSVRLLRLGTLM
jgi:hypothetical protein